MMSSGGVVERCDVRGRSSGFVLCFLVGATFALVGCTASQSDDESQPVAVVVADSNLSSQELDPATTATTTTVDVAEDKSLTVVEVADDKSLATTGPDGLRVLDIDYTVEDGVVSGQVLENGQPVSNVHVRLQDPDTKETFQERGTDLDGRYKFGPLDPACYMTKAVAPDNAQWVDRYNSKRYAWDYMCIEE